MQLTDAPAKLVLPFADAGAKNTIPVASQVGITPGAASLTDGFPPLTRTPIASGGIPPSGLDMNGVLYEVTAPVRWANAGAGYVYDGTFATDADVGGYPKGARILRTDGEGYWLNTTDDNATDPEAGGAGWVPDYTSGAASVAMSNANVTLTSLQAGRPVIIITGTLTANLNLVFPAYVKQWLVINRATGAYSVTCKTSAGTGVTVATGAQAQILGDGTNVVEGASSQTTTVDAGLQEFRLTLTTGVPVTTADVTAATTLYLTPYNGNRIALYDGASAWNERASAQMSIAVPATTGTNYDVFVYDNGGTPTLELTAWTNDTTRATALTYQDGVLVKTGATTRRYVGSFRTSGVSGQTTDSLANRLVWNCNNRVDRQARGTFSADRATASTTYVELNSEIRMGFVVGVSEDALSLNTTGSVAGDANRWAGCAFAFDGTTAEAGLEGGAVAGGAIGAGTKGGCDLIGYKTGLSAGYHYATILGKTDSGTCTWQSATGTLGAKFYANMVIKG